jgi:hypothetical protein
MAGFTGIFMLATFALGFICEGRANVRGDEPLTTVQRMFTLHLLGGLASTLLSLMLHSLVFTYFIGTGRWVQEVLNAYRLPSSIWEEARRLKMRALPFILGSISLMIATATMGAASDRGLLNHNVHLMTAVLAVMVNFWSYLREYQLVAANNQIIARVMQEVTRMRRERGLDVPAPVYAAGDASNVDAADTE